MILHILVAVRPACATWPAHTTAHAAYQSVNTTTCRHLLQEASRRKCIGQKCSWGAECTPAVAVVQLAQQQAANLAKSSAQRRGPIAVVAGGCVLSRRCGCIAPEHLPHSCLEQGKQPPPGILPVVQLLKRHQRWRAAIKVLQVRY